MRKLCLVIPTWLGCLFVVLLFCFCNEASAENLPGLENAAPVTLTADEVRFEEQTGTYEALGKVRLQKGHYSLMSDKVSWNPENEDATATGHVLLLDNDGNYLSGEEAQLNMASGQGSVNGGRGFWKQSNFHLAAQEIQKLDDKNFEAREAVFTSCDAETPFWKFKTKELKITTGEYARAKHVFFYLKDVPVLYFPYFTYPVGGRKSGFLIPSYGMSDNKGMQISQSYYWAISRNTDATFYMDYFSKLGLGKGIEYRYIQNEENEGDFKFYHINGWDQGEDRYAFSWNHEGFLPKDVRLVADVEYVDKKDFFEDFGKEAEEYNKDTVYSILFAQHNWEKLNLSGQLKYTKDLEASNDETLQSLPDVRLSLIRKNFRQTPFFYGFDTSSNYLWREEGNKGERLVLRPYAAAVFKPTSFLDIDAEIGFLERLYWTSDDNVSEGLFDFSVGVSNRMHRVYSPGGKFIKKIKHTLEPELRYSYRPPENQESLPQFDLLDDIEPENKLSFSLINRLTARLEPDGEEPRYHEFFYLRLAQEFDIREARRNREGSDDPLRPFSPLRSEMIVRPTTWSFVDVDATYDMNPEEKSFVIFRSRGGFNDQVGNELSFGYSYREKEFEYGTGAVDTSLLDPLFLSYRYRYDFTESTTLEHVLKMEYRFQCWGINLMYRDKTDDQEVWIEFSLRGIGNVFGFGNS